MTLNFGMHHRVLKYDQVCLNDDPGLTLTYLWQGQIWFLMLLYGKKGKQWIFQQLLSTDLKLATNDRSDKKFLLASNLCPLGAVCPPATRLYTCIKLWKKLYKIRLQGDFFETCNKWVKRYIKAFLLTSKFCPLGAVCPCPGAIDMY